jgi:hydrogenase nickel incorporation protein HypA/HybF
MHELSITQNIVAVVAEKAAGRRVSAVTLVVGDLAGIDVSAVRFCFDLCTNGTPLSGATLHVEQVQGRARCNACGTEVTLTEPVLRCDCSPDATLVIIAGEELRVRSMEVHDV